MKIKHVRTNLALLMITFAVLSDAFAAECTLSGTVSFEPTWVEKVNATMKQTPGASLKYQWIRLRPADKHEVTKNVYTKQFPDGQSFPNNSIQLAPIKVNCNEAYSFEFIYDISKIQVYSAQSNMTFSSKEGNTEVNLQFPKDFNQNAAH